MEDAYGQEKLPRSQIYSKQFDGMDYDIDLTLTVVMETTDEEEVLLLSWHCIPDNILLHILSYVPAHAVLQASLTCRWWYRVAHDEYLWKGLFYRNWQIPSNIAMAPGKTSWLQEYKRLYYHCPVVESEVIKQHGDQVLHVSFSHNGKMFATSSKDGYIRVWNATYPVSLKYKEDMKRFTWKYTQFSQFNDSDTLLLVSGVHFGSNSTSGEIAVFTLQGEFELQARVINKPYDVFGTWYNDSYLLSGNLHWTGQLQSCSALWLNKASQETESEHESVVMRLYRFHNVNASSIRTIMIANCPVEGESPSQEDMAVSMKPEASSAAGANMILYSESDILKNLQVEEEFENEEDNNSPGAQGGRSLQSIRIFEDGAFKTKLIQLDEDEMGDKLNGTIEYGKDYREAENEIQSLADALQVEVAMDTVEPSSNVCLGNPGNNSSTTSIARSGQPTKDVMNATDNFLNGSTSEDLSKTNKQFYDRCLMGGKRKNAPNENSSGSKDCSETSDVLNSSTQQEPENCVDKCNDGMYLNGAIFGSPLQSSFFSSANHRHALPERKSFSRIHSGDASIRYGVGTYKTASSNGSDPKISKLSRNKSPSLIEETKTADKFLIFTMGSLTYTPHQIGIKRIKSLESVHGSVSQLRLLPDVDEQQVVDGDRDSYDTVDKIIEMHGHIIGLCLSPDHRYLYVNTRQWPKNYKIENAIYPPPIAQEIDIHVIDLLSMREVGTMHRSHKAYTPNDECFFIFLDVCQEYVASGAEDKHGYIWDRHYGVCLNKFPHSDVVNCVAFKPTDTETLVTVSDDVTIKVWRSRYREKELRKRNYTCVM